MIYSAQLVKFVSSLGGSDVRHLLRAADCFHLGLQLYRGGPPMANPKRNLTLRGLELFTPGFG